MDDSHFDAVIIGSGFGGSVMAYRLAEAGLRVRVLERGKAYPPFSFPRSPHRTRANFWDPSQGLYGMYNVWSFKGSGALVSSGLGGGSLIYANVTIRKDENWFVRQDLNQGKFENWPINRQDLEPHYDRVAEMQNIQRYPDLPAPYRDTPKRLAMIEAAEKLKACCPHEDVQLVPLNLAVSFRQHQVLDPLRPDEVNNPPVIGEPITERYGKNYHGKTRYTCVLCGECDFGCNTGSKNTLDYTYLTAAKHHGAWIEPLCEVKSIAPSPIGGYRVDFLRHDPDRWEGVKIDTSDRTKFPTETITCDRLIIAAGTFGSPFLLFKNRDVFPGLSPKLGSRFGVNGDLLAFIAKCQETKNGKTVPRLLDPSFGPVITTAIRLGDQLDGLGAQGRGFYLEDAGNPSLVNWGVELTGFVNLLYRGARFAKSFLRYRLGFTKNADLDLDIATLIGDCAQSKSYMPVIAMGRDIPDGNLAYDGKYLACDWRIDRSQAYYDRVTRIIKEIANALNGEYQDNLSFKHFRQVLTAHPLGGCPMGESWDEGVVDSYGEVYRHPELYVVDGSIMPGSIGPNPSMTIAAISDRAADRIIERYKITKR
jgi:cholesterol oxidase